jgi:hypothetical protein
MKASGKSWFNDMTITTKSTNKEKCAGLRSSAEDRADRDAARMG